MKSLIRVTACTVGVALALLPAASATPRLPAACDLLTNAEVVKVLGDKLQTRVPDAGGQLNACEWNGVPLGTFTTAAPQLSISVARVSRARFNSAEFGIVPGSQPGQVQQVRATPVKGIGQAAYTFSTMDNLEVWNHGVIISVSATTVLSPLQVAKAAAKIAIVRLS